MTRAYVSGSWRGKAFWRIQEKQLRRKLGNNLIIKDGKLLLDQSKAFFLIQKGYDSVNLLAKKLEPNKEVITPIQMLRLEPICTSWRREGDSNPR